MNTALYASVERIGLGLAVTIEFLGPLAVALATGGEAHGRRGPRAQDAACGALALAGVVLLTGAFGGARLDPLGLLLGVAAAVLWAAYILLNQRAGALPGVTGTAVASLTGTVLTLPFLLVILAGVPRGGPAARAAHRGGDGRAVVARSPTRSTS